MKARLITALIATLVLAGSVGDAHAQEGGTRGPGGIRDTSPQARDQNLSAMLFIPWWHGIGAGVMLRYEIPIVPSGFIPQINDQFSLEPSLGLAFRRSYGYYGFDDDRARALDIAPALYANWSFHVTNKFRPYVALGFGYNIGVELGDVEWDSDYFYFDSAVGLFYRFSQAAALRAELGAWGPKVGFSFFF